MQLDYPQPLNQGNRNVVPIAVCAHRVTHPREVCPFNLQARVVCAARTTCTVNGHAEMRTPWKRGQRDVLNGRGWVSEDRLERHTIDRDGIVWEWKPDDVAHRFVHVDKLDQGT